MKSKNNNTKKKAAPSNKAPKMNFWQWFEQFSQNKWVIGVMLVVLSFVFLANYSSIYDRKVDLNGDNIYYYSLGQALSHGEGYTNIISLSKSPHSHFPPGYPYFISKIIKIFPEDIQTVKRANGFLLYSSVIMFFFVILLITKNSLLAFCTSILMSMHKELLRFATIMMSETLFIFLSILTILLALLIVKGIIGSKRPWMVWVVMGIYALLVGYTYLVRTMGLSLILAEFAWLGILAISAGIHWWKARKQQDEAAISTWRNSFMRTGLLCLITILALGVAKFSWDARNEKLGIKGGDYEATFMKKTNNETMQGAEDWKIRIKSNTSNFITRWIPEATYMKEEVNSESKISSTEWILGLLLITVMILGCLYLNCGRLLMLFYMGLTIGVLILYPEQYGGLRYLTPVMPFFIFLFLNGLCAIVGGIYKLLKMQNSPLFAQGVLLLLVTFAFLAPRYAEAQTAFKKSAKMKSWFSTPDINASNFLSAARFCGDSLAEDARVVNRKPELFYMFSHFRSSSSFSYYAEPDTIYNMLCRDSIDYVIIDSWFRHAYVTLYPCVQKYPEKFKLVKKFGEVDTVRHINPTLIFQFNDKWGYQGDMKNGVREGQGVLNMQDGRSYKGAFANNLPNGYGTIYDANGKAVAAGIWKDGALVQFMQPK